MPSPYAVDLRWRIVWLTYFQHHQVPYVASLLNVSTRTVRRYTKLFELTGDVVPRPRRNGPHPSLDEHHQLMILRLIMDKPGIYLSEIQGKIFSEFGLVCSAPNIKINGLQ